MFSLWLPYPCCSSALQTVMSRDGCNSISCPMCSSYCVTLACLPSKGWKWPSPDTHDIHFSISFVYTMHISGALYGSHSDSSLARVEESVFIRCKVYQGRQTIKQTIEVNHTKSCYNVKTGWGGQWCAEADSCCFMRVDCYISRNFANWLLSIAVIKN